MPPQSAAPGSNAEQIGGNVAGEGAEASQQPVPQPEQTQQPPAPVTIVADLCAGALRLKDGSALRKPRVVQYGAEDIRKGRYGLCHASQRRVNKGNNASAKRVGLLLVHT